MFGQSAKNDGDKKTSEESDKTMDMLTRDDYQWAFDPYAYLNAFYSRYTIRLYPMEDSAMTMVLSLLPIVAARLPRCRRLLDIGSGPTVHVPIVFRRKVDEIYLSDYLPQNRELLRKWLRNDESFDWSVIVRFLLCQEADHNCAVDQAETQAKLKVQSVLACDILSANVIEPSDVGSDFDIVTSFFCIEYAVRTHAEYCRALSNVTGLVKMGGYLVLAGVLSETWYQFGGRRFSCYRLDENELFSLLNQCGMDTREQQLIYYNHCDVFLLVGKRIL
ncbi:NNMT PNMT TEMT domain containing protein [Trichuris trichiura]|uniref:NNMT PNMT TEMT domain containing protein n=1 Tax=Trichuris trichiura TaxID=36087 RepID=A0A077YZ31_TRITR|nr:NNMT PNMT TEMT domain containing protein [Trichuris trichiura]